MSPEGSIALADQRGPTQRSLLQSLLENPPGLTVDQLVARIGVTANAVRQHLTALSHEGLVGHEPRPAPRGRPQHVYRLTPRGREAFPRRYRELAELVLEELSDHMDGAALGGAMRRMGARAARGLGGAARSVEATAAQLTQLGYEARPQGPREIVALNCVFHHLAGRFSSVCEFDLGFMEAATGRKVEHRDCMLRGGACCRFRFAAAPAAAPRRRKPGE